MMSQANGLLHELCYPASIQPVAVVERNRPCSPGVVPRCRPKRSAARTHDFQRHERAIQGCEKMAAERLRILSDRQQQDSARRVIGKRDHTLPPSLKMPASKSGAAVASQV
jgi:hypothetical protein